MAIQPVQDEPTIGRLVSDASRDISSLLQKEIQLAKSEIKVSVRNGGLGLGLFAGAAFFAVMGADHVLGRAWPTSSTGTARASTCTGRSSPCSCCTC